MAEPTEDDLKIFRALSKEDQRALLIAELEKGLKGTPRPSSAADVVRRGMIRNGHSSG
ncbi:MAG: hypothetical protein ACR2PI_19600 [Hyphomicrobiaceae bacterium]